MGGTPMSYLRLIETARTAFEHLPSDVNTVILHPQFRYHNALIEALVSSCACDALYITLPAEGGLAALWDNLASELREGVQVVLPGWGGWTPAEASNRFLEALDPIRALILVLAAYDQADQAIHEFVVSTARQAHAKLRFLLDSRVWPYQLMSQPGSGAGFTILPVSAEDMLLDYLNRDDKRVVLEVRALGSGQVLIDGRQIDQWDGALPRALFFYFVDRGMTTRDEVFSTFWPELSTREATNVFHVTKRKISEILNVDLTVYSSGFYRISPHIDLFYDVVAFAEAVQNSAVAEPEDARLLLERAIGLHERDFLGDFGQAWAIRRRDELRRTYVDALATQGRLYEDEGMLMEALGLYSRAFGLLPQREDLARNQMRLYAQAGQPDRALAVYNRLVSELDTSLGVGPSPETITIAEEIRYKQS